MHDLLKDPLIGVRTAQGVRHVSLPELLASLSAGQVENYTGLRAHQADPWHVFLVQLAASIQARRPTEALPTDAAYWRDGLLDLAEGVAEAWHLVVEDVTKPAFLQHPDCHGANFKPCADAPDEFDVLFTSKNHDVKSARIRADEPEAWIYAITTRQTISPYGGGGGTLNGIARMNSGSGSRPIVSWVRDLHPSQRFLDEVSELRRIRGSILEARYGYNATGVVLTWLRPWDHRKHQFFLSDLDPWFVEAPRLVRLRYEELTDGIVALQAGTKARQIGPKESHKGDVGDPWIPITTEGTALTITSPGFTPERLCKLIFKQGIQRSTGLLDPGSSDSYGWLVASVLSGGNCKTDGFHRVELPVPPQARMALFNREKRDTLAHLAQKLLSDAKDVQGALGIALTVLTEAAPDRLDFKRVASWVKAVRSQFGKQWDLLYFSTLWRGVEESHDTVRVDWQQRLVDAGQALLDEGSTHLPLPTNRRWRALTQSQSAWRGMLRKGGLPLPLPGRVAAGRVEPLEKVV
ncbi:hypothetical protein [Denitratimonas sp. CY0512]|uniref:hypothetical protein n=1 Tax=Denitratimonas sp. CY0512 TaxID=3131940 RepID=UPI0030A02105